MPPLCIWLLWVTIQSVHDMFTIETGKDRDAISKPVDASGYEHNRGPNAPAICGKY